MVNVEEDREKAGRVAGCAEMRDVRLFGVHGDLADPGDVGGLGYSLDVDTEYQTIGEEVAHALVVTGKYSLSVTGVSGNESQEPSEVATLSFTLAGMYSLLEQDTDPITFSDEELQAFAATTGQFALYPYAREFVASMTGRMGLPPLHLGTLRFDRDEPED